MPETDQASETLPNHAGPRGVKGKRGEAEVRPVRLPNNLMLWLHLDTFAIAQDPSSVIHEGRGIEISGNPSRTNQANIAALVALTAKPLVVERIGRVVEIIDLFHKRREEQRKEEEEEEEEEEEVTYPSQPHESTDPLEKLKNLSETLGKWATEMPADVMVGDLAKKEQLELIMALLKHYRPEFDNLSVEEQLSLVEETSGHINKFLAASRELTNFLEYGKPGGLFKNPFKSVSQQLRAAVLRDVYGYSSAEIGELLNISPTSSDEIRRENQSARKKADEGKALWEQAFGKEGWQERVEFMRAEGVRWEKLSLKERYIEELAEAEGMSTEEVCSVLADTGFDKTLDEWQRAYEQGNIQRAVRIQLTDPRYGMPLGKWDQE